MPNSIFSAPKFISLCFILGGIGCASPAKYDPKESELIFRVSPSAVTLYGGSTTTFAAVISNATGKLQFWTIVEDDGGSIDLIGNYTAPITPGTFHVQAVITNSGRQVTASSTVTVIPPLEAYCHTRFAEGFTSPGNDATWGTSDDHQVSYAHRYIDAKDDHLILEKVYLDSGLDTGWGTSDDYLGGTYTERYDANWNLISSTYPEFVGGDGWWGTEDDVYGEVRYLYVNGSNTAVLTYSGGQLISRVSMTYTQSHISTKTYWREGPDAKLGTL